MKRQSKADLLKVIEQQHRYLNEKHDQIMRLTGPAAKLWRIPRCIRWLFNADFEKGDEYYIE